MRIPKPFRPVPFLLFLPFFASILTSAPATAGDVKLEWDASAGATSYTVYRGTTPLTYTSSDPVGNVTEAAVEGLEDCTRWYFAVTASNDAGESDYSGEISSWPRPSPDTATPQELERGRRLDLVVTGLNFETGASLSFSNSGIALNSVSVVSCSRIEANVTVSGAADLGPVDVEVTNTSGIRGNGTALLTVVRDSNAPSISLVDAVEVGGTSALVTWTTDEQANSQVRYRKLGTTTYLETAVDSAMVTDHEVRLEGLAPETVYEYHVTSADSEGNTATSSPDRRFTTLTSPFTYITFEAESGMLTDPVRRTTRGDAFAGRVIDTAPGHPSGTPSDPLGTATYGVHIPASGTWHLWFRIYGSTSASDSWYESVDGGSRSVVSATELGRWVWVPGRSHALDEGLHDLELGGREAGARVDRILLTDDPGFNPTEGPGDDISPPATVRELAAGPADRANLLSWINPNDEDYSRTVVRYRTDGRYPVSPADGFPVVDLESTPGASESYVHDGLVNGVTYHYSAFAVDDDGNAADRATTLATPPGGTVPDPPQNLRIVSR